MKNRKGLFSGLMLGITILGLLGAKITSNTLWIGKGTAADVSLVFDKGSGSTNPYVKWDNSTSKIKFSHDGATSFDLGAASGVGSIAYNDTNTDLESSTTGYTTYADAAATTPVDGTGGTASITITKNTTTPIRGGGDLKISKGATNRQGDGVSYDMTVPVGYRTGQLSQICFAFNTNSANYAAGDLGVFIYDVTNSTLITPSTTAIPKSQNRMCYAWNQGTATSYRLIFHVTSTNASAWDAYIDDIVVGPGSPVQSANVSATYTGTPTFANEGAIAFTDKNSSWQRVGDALHFTATARATADGAGATVVGINLPTTFGTITAVTGNYPVVNIRYTAADVSPATSAWVVGDGTSIIKLRWDPLRAGNLQTQDFGTSSGRATQINVDAVIQIAEWVGAGTFTASNNVEYACNSDTTANVADTTTFAYGPAGCQFGNHTATTAKRVRFQTRIQPTDKIEFQFSTDSGTTWQIRGATDTISPYTVQNTNSYGVYTSQVNTTDMDVSFRPYRFPNGATFGAAGSLWADIDVDPVYKWRMVKVSGGYATGFGYADTANSGLVSTTTQTFAGIKNNASMPSFRADLNGSNATYNVNATLFDLTWNDSSSANAFDIAGNFASGSNGTFTVPTGAGGTYLVTASIQFTNDADLVAGGVYGMRCYKNGSASILVVDQFLQVAARGFYRAATALVNMAAGDTLNCRAVSNQNHSVNTIVISGDIDSTYWSATKLH